MFVEIKQRNVNSSKYKDAMIGMNKTEYCKGKEADRNFVSSFI